MFNVLDHNKDQKVTESDFESLAVKFLCGQDSFSQGFNSNTNFNNTQNQRSSSSFTNKKE